MQRHADGEGRREAAVCLSSPSELSGVQPLNPISTFLSKSEHTVSEKCNRQS